MVPLADESLLEVPGLHGGRPTSTSRQDSFTSSCGSFLSPSQYDGTASDVGSCYDIMEDELSTHQTLAENEMADLEVEMCEKNVQSSLTNTLTSSSFRMTGSSAVGKSI